MGALRADQWLENHPEADDAQRRAIKQQVRDAFYTDTDVWKERIVEQGVDAAYGAVRGLSGAGDLTSRRDAAPFAAQLPRRADDAPSGSLRVQQPVRRHRLVESLQHQLAGRLRSRSLLRDRP